MANPMQEFVGEAEELSRHHEHLFHHYTEKFRKRYDSEKEAEHRKHHFIHNSRYGEPQRDREGHSQVNSRTSGGS